MGAEYLNWTQQHKRAIIQMRRVGLVRNEKLEREKKSAAIFWRRKLSLHSLVAYS